MKHLILSIVLLASLVSCDTEEVVVESLCGTHATVRATVRDLTGFDGCGFVLELENGDRLEPLFNIFRWCGTPPFSGETINDPLNGFEFYDGQIVNVAYENAEHLSVCMVGTTVYITCIEDIALSSNQTGH